MQADVGIRSELLEFRRQFSEEMSALRADVSSDIQSLRSELSSEIQLLRADLTKMQDRVRQIGSGVVGLFILTLASLIANLA